METRILLNTRFGLTTAEITSIDTMSVREQSTALPVGTGLGLRAISSRRWRRC